MVTVERVQTGFRIERGVLKVLKGLSEYLDISLGELVEGIVLHAFEGKAPFEPSTLRAIEQLKNVYGLELGANDSHRLSERRADDSHRLSERRADDSHRLSERRADDSEREGDSHA